MQDDVRRIMRQNRQIRYRITKGKDNSVELRLREATDVEKAKTLLREITRPVAAGSFSQTAITEVELEEPDEGVLRFSLTAQGISHAMSQCGDPVD